MEPFFCEEHKDYMLAEANLKCESKNAEQSFSTVLFVIFRDNLIQNRLEIYCTNRGCEESREKEYFEKVRLEIFTNETGAHFTDTRIARKSESYEGL